MNAASDSSDNPAPPEAAGRTFPFHPFLMALFPVFVLYASNYQEVIFSEVAWLSLGVLLIAASLYSLRLFYPSLDRAALAATYLLVMAFFYNRMKVSVESFRPDVILDFIRFRYFLAIWVLFSVACVLGARFLPTSRSWWMRGLFGGAFLFVACTYMWYFETAAAVALLTLLVWGVYSWRAGLDKTSTLIVALMLGVLFFERFPLATWLGVVIFGLIAIRFTAFEAQKATRLLNIFSAILICFSTYNLATLAYTFSLPTQTGESQELQSVKLSLPEHPKDIYFLVFDRYPGLRTLSDELHFDNRPFYEQLSQRGFTLPLKSRSNYAKTYLSMATALNMHYMEEEIHPAQWYYPLLRNPNAIRLLREAGYKYYHLGNWASFLRSSDYATENYKFATFKSRFASIFWSLTPLASWLPEQSGCEITVGQNEFLHRIAKEPGPKVVYVHFLLPHTPYCFRADGTKLTRKEEESMSVPEKFVGQLQFANKVILDFVDEVQADSKSQPIIVIQADEGPFGFMEEIEANRLARMRCRTDIISAFYLPDDPHQEIDIPEDITPVNTFRLIFKKYFDAEIPLLPDKVNFWEHEHVINGEVQYNPLPTNGNRFIDVTDALEEGKASPEPREP